jgi:phospholipase C
MTVTNSPTGLLSSIDHVVVLMLENRSFDHMLGYLYTEENNFAPSGAAFDGLTGDESNPAADGSLVVVKPASAEDANLYFLPGADPGEGYLATNSQLYGATTTSGAPTNSGFVSNFAYTLGWEATNPDWSVLAGTVATDIMTMYTPAQLPVLSALARGFAVCDQWFASAPTETLPNRAFALAATSQGHMDDRTHTFTAPTIFGLLSQADLGWAVYGYSSPPLTRQTFTDITDADDSHFGTFPDFQAAAAAGTLPAFTFLEPSWEASGNSQHPNYDVARGEQLLSDVYRALRTGPAWARTLWVVTYDEHGGCYDHVAPPSGAVPPDSSAGEYGFDFTRFGVRVPTVIVSPLIAAGTVFRAPEGSAPLDHTSVLKTVEARFGLAPLTARDAAAPGVGAVLTLGTARTDDPLDGVTAPTATSAGPPPGRPSHLLRVHAELVSRLPVDGRTDGPPTFATSQEYTHYVRARTEAWRQSAKRA